MKLLTLELTTPERVALRTRARSVSIPTVNGEITILPDHVPLVAPIKAGELRLIDEAGSEQLLAVSGGFVVLQENDSLAILADTAERAEELDLKAIEAAHARAEELMKEKIDDEERYAEVATGLARELARLKVLRKHRSRKGFQNLQ